MLWFMQTDEYALEGLRGSTIRYLTSNFHTIRAETQQTLTKRLRSKLQVFDRHSLHL